MKKKTYVAPASMIMDVEIETLLASQSMQVSNTQVTNDEEVFSRLVIWTAID